MKERRGQKGCEKKERYPQWSARCDWIAEGMFGLDFRMRLASIGYRRLSEWRRVLDSTNLLAGALRGFDSAESKLLEDAGRRRLLLNCPIEDSSWISQGLMSETLQGRTTAMLQSRLFASDVVHYRLL